MSELSGGTPPQDDPIKELAGALIDLAYAENGDPRFVRTETENQWHDAFQRAVYYIEDSVRDGILTGEDLVSSLTSLVRYSGNMTTCKELDDALNFRKELYSGQYIYGTKHGSRVQMIIEDPCGRAAEPVLKVSPRYKSAYPDSPQLAYEVTVANEDGQPTRIKVSNDEYETGKKTIEQALDDELRVASIEDSPAFQDVLRLMQNFDLFGKPEKANDAKKVLATIVLRSSNLSRYSDSDLSYIGKHLPDALQHVYDRVAKDMSHSLFVDYPEDATDFAKSYLIATNPDYHYQSVSGRNQLIFKTLLDLNERGRQLREAEVQK